MYTVKKSLMLEMEHARKVEMVRTRPLIPALISFAKYRQKSEGNFFCKPGSSVLIYLLFNFVRIIAN